MTTAHGTMATDRPRRYAKQLVSHWARRGPVTDEAGTIRQVWSDGRTIELRPAAGVLHVDVAVPDGEDVRVFTDIVARHLERFGQREELAVVWDD